MSVAMTDAIPLMQADGTTARNNARDIRTQLLSSLYLPDSGGYGVRPGVLPRQFLNTNGFEWVDLKVIQLDTPGQAVKLYPGRAVVVRTGQGPYLLSQETTVTNYALDAADASNPRYDVIYLRLYDQVIGDSGAGPHGPYIDHVNGTPSGSPVVPSVPTDALPLARILRAANDNTIASADITDVRKSTQVHSSPRPMLPGDLLADSGIMVGDRRLRMATSAQITAGSPAFIEEIWCADGKWRNTRNNIVGRNQRTTTVSTSATTAGTAFRIFTAVAQVQAGTTYEVSFQGELRNTASPSTAEVDFRYTTTGVEPTVSDAQLFRAVKRMDNISVPETVSVKKLYPAATDHEFRVTAAMFSAIGGGTLTFDCSATSPGELVITDRGPTVAEAGTDY